jgi:hypothetical protein
VAQRNDRPAGAIRRTEFGLQVRLPQVHLFLIHFQEHTMSAPSRRPEIRRRRARQHKITTLRKRLASAQTDADRTRVTAKLHKLAIASPGQPLLK